MRKPKWYAIQVQVGKEDRLRKDITKKVRIESMERLIRQVILKRHPEAVLRKQKIETHQKKSFPGYLLLEMIANHDSISFVKGFKGVIGFLPSNEHPIPLKKEEVRNLNGKPKKEEVEIRIDYDVGDYVDVVSGPFKGMTGKVLDIDEWKPGLIRISVQVEIMGKKVPVDLSWKEVELA